MEFPQIKMESQFAKIGIKQNPAQIELTQGKADVSIEQPKAEMSIQAPKGKLTIDQSQAWEEMNLMSTKRLNEKYAAEGLRAASEGTERRAEEGAGLIDIHKNVDMFAEQAYQKNNTLKPLGFKYIPSPFAVKISYEPGDVQIDVQENKPIIDAQVIKPELTYYRGNVTITMEQYAQLNIDFENMYV